VIGAELQFECANLTLWEKLFLHLLPAVRGLRLELCGPELRVPADLAAVLEKPMLCADCRRSGRTLDVVFHCGKLYHQVTNDEPDLVCLFNPGLYRTTGYANQVARTLHSPLLRQNSVFLRYQTPTSSLTWILHTRLIIPNAKFTQPIIYRQ
jgi:hypothetical protein